MAICSFAAIGTNPRGLTVWRCSACKTELAASHSPKNRSCGPRRNQKQKAITANRRRLTRDAGRGVCQFRGAMLREQGCKPCQAQGRSLIEVFGCDKHKECTLENTAIHPRIKACSTCVDFVPLVQLEMTPRRRKITIVSCGFYHGGAERWVISLARWLPHDILAVVNAHPDNADPTMIEDLRQCCPYLNWGTREASEAVRNADIVISWGPVDLAEILKNSPAKSVWVNHTAGPLSTPIIERLEPWVDHWVGVSEICRNSFPAKIAHLMTVVHNGADVERTTPVHGRAAMRAKWGLTDDQIAVGYVGRMSPEKRPHAVAEAVASLPSQFVAILIGGGRQEKETRELCELIAPGRCIFAGHQHRSIGDALAGLDVWLNASPSESFCLSLLEAQLAGVPCVSTSVGVLPELRETFGQLAIEVPVKATRLELANAVQMAKRGEITERAYRVARDHFTSPAMANRWDAYLNGL